MTRTYHYIETTVRYLTTSEGGRKTGVTNDYRGQFHYEGDEQPWDGIQFFPDLSEGEFVQLGSTVRAFVRLIDDDHARLAKELLRFKRARVVVSYYDDPRLAELYPDWTIGSR